MLNYRYLLYAVGQLLAFEVALGGRQALKNQKRHQSKLSVPHQSPIDGVHLQRVAALLPDFFCVPEAPPQAWIFVFALEVVTYPK